MCTTTRVAVRGQITCTITKGSVLGPLLWLIAYDNDLRLPLPRIDITIGYADDTLIVAEGDSVESAKNQTNVALEIVSKGIRDLGLQ